MLQCLVGYFSTTDIPSFLYTLKDTQGRTQVRDTKYISFRLGVSTEE